jgi:hypothetical protein
MVLLRGMSFGFPDFWYGNRGGNSDADSADLWRDRGSNLVLIEPAQEPRLAGKENG